MSGRALPYKVSPRGSNEHVHARHLQGKIWIAHRCARDCVCVVSCVCYVGDARMRVMYVIFVGYIRPLCMYATHVMYAANAMYAMYAMCVMYAMYEMNAMYATYAM